MVRLGDLVEIRGGGTPDRSVAAYWGGGIPWASVKDFKSTSISSTAETITELGVANSATNIISAGSILVPTRMAVGRAAINTVDLAINQDLKALRPGPRVDARYLLHSLLANAPTLARRATGATVKGITLDVLRDLPIRLPGLDEQRRTAAILDQADGLLRARSETLSRLSALRQAQFHNMFGGPAEILATWPISELRDVVRAGTIVTYGMVQAGDEYPGGVPYVRTGDIVDGRVLRSQLRRADPAIAARFERSRVEAGDLIMSIRATVGTTALVPEDLSGANLTQGTARIAPGPKVKSLYLLSYLRSEGAQRWIARQVKGATFREITLARLRELPVPVPPVALQEAFCLSLAHIDLLEEAATSQRAHLAALFASLQHRAFNAERTRSDERMLETA